jgi:hypothetical protein
VYTAEFPLVTKVPTAGENDQATPLKFAPLVIRVTDLELGVRLAEPGEMLNAGTATVERLTEADALCVGSAALVAVILIVWAAEMVPGAV